MSFSIYILLIIHIGTHCKCSGSSNDDVPDLAFLQNYAEKLSVKLNGILKDVSKIDKLKEAFEAHIADMQFVEVDGQKLVDEMAAKISKALKKKEASLQKSVSYAETIAAAYKWNSNIKLGDVTYIKSKEIGPNDTDYEYSEVFKQNVNYNVSSVHIPVEIFEGAADIQNDLGWTTGLEYIWQKNQEEDPTLLWQYFGGQTGISRTFPASRWKSSGVDLYDARRRPWYTQGASSPKDMLILIDTSGSTFGQALSLMKESVRSILDTLNENDFVNIVRFSSTATLIGCFDTFVQAHKRNKEALSEHVNKVVAKGMASYVVGFKFAFEQFIAFDARPEGAKCNKIIMFLTDGGTEMPEQLFAKYNANKEIRIFSYAVGPIANPIAAVKWIACNNRGFFYKIPAMGAIRSLVQDYLTVLARSEASHEAKHYHWTNIKVDQLAWPITHEPKSTGYVYERLYKFTGSHEPVHGLGMMTTVTLPVFNRTTSGSNQTILGVMGVDMLVEEMEEHIPTKQLGPNGYAFAMDHNGYVLFHPNLKAKKGWLPDPPNVDLLEVEYETLDKIKLRRDMIDNNHSSSGPTSITTFVLMADEQHADIKERNYYFSAIAGSQFSCAIVLPSYAKQYVSRTTPIDIDEGIAMLQPEDSEILIAPWTFCPSIQKSGDGFTNVSDFIHILRTRYEACDSVMVQRLFHDAKVTAVMDRYWREQHQSANNLDHVSGIEGQFVATSGGITRIYPPEAAELLRGVSDTWQAGYFRRAVDNDFWVFSAPYHTGPAPFDPNATEPIVIAARNISIGQHQYQPAVAGVLLSQDKLRKLLLEYGKNCKLPNLICYLLDDGGFVIVSSDEEDSFMVGQFLAEIDPLLMHALSMNSVFLQKTEYDFQAACSVPLSTTSAGRISIVLPFFFEMLSLQWWSAQLSWLYLNYNVYSWLVSGESQYVNADTIMSKNSSCIKRLAQYYLPEDDDPDQKEKIECGNCSRIVATARLPNTNLLMVMANRNCQPPGECETPSLLHSPVETVDPNFSEGQCNITRYRRRPQCYQYDANEDNTRCSAADNVSHVSVLLNLHLLIVLLVAALR